MKSRHFIDVNESGQLDEEHEPSGQYPLNPFTVSGVTSGIDIAMTDLSLPPEGITLDNETVPENLANAKVGTLSAIDPDEGDTHSFVLVEGDHSEDNGVSRL